MAEIFQPPPPNPFMGGAQPLEQRQFVPSTPAAPTVNNPPFGQLYTIFEPWIDAFVMPQRAAQIAAIIPVAITPAAYVPPPDTAVQTSIVQAWQVPDAPLPQRGAQIAPLIPVTPADNPPFRHLDTVFEPFVAEAWIPPRRNFVPQGAAPAVVNNPPFTYPARLPVYVSIVQSWQPPDPLPIQPRYVVQPSVTVQVDNPPFGQDILSLWRDDWPLPQRPVQIAAILSAAPTPPVVNNPPFGQLDTIFEPWSTDWLLPILPPKLVQPGAPPVVNNPPFRHPGRWPGQVAVNVSWAPPDPLPTLPRYVVQPGPPVVVNNPPFSHPGRWAGQVAVNVSWQPPDPPPTLPRYLVQPGAVTPAVVNNPPFGQLYTIFEPWFADAPLPTLPRRAVPPSVDNPPGYPASDIVVIEVDAPLPQRPVQIAAILAPAPTPPSNPPFTHRGRLAVTAEIIGQWQPPDPQPILPRYVAQPGPAVVVNNPPFSHPGRWPGQVAVNVSWLPPDPLPTLPQKLVQPGPAVVVNNPPFSHPGRWPGQVAINVSWQPIDPPPTLPQKLVPPSVDNPPFSHAGRLPAYQSIIASWQPPDPPPTLPRQNSPGIPGQSVDNPPFTHPGRTVVTAEIIGQWQPADPQPTQPVRYLVQPSAPAAVAFIPSPPKWLSTVLGWWQPGDPLPELAGKLPPSILNNPPRVDNPPFTHQGRTVTYAQIVAMWQPPDPPPTQLIPSAPTIPPPKPPVTVTGQHLLILIGVGI
jgi:hypothetical protein